MNVGRQGPLRTVKRRFITLGTGKPGTTPSHFELNDDTVVHYKIEMDCGHELWLHVGSYDYTGARGAKVKCDQCPTKKQQYNKVLDEVVEGS